MFTKGIHSNKQVKSAEYGKISCQQIGWKKFKTVAGKKKKAKNKRKKRKHTHTEEKKNNELNKQNPQ